MKKSCTKDCTHSGALLFPTKSVYLLNQNTLVHPLSLKFCVPTQPKYSRAPSFYQILRTCSTKYSSAPSSPQNLRTYLTKIFKCTRFPSNSAYLLDQTILECTLIPSNSAYLLDQSILMHPLSLEFRAPTQPKYSGAPLILPFLRTYLTKIF
jgi:hypothetical protein